MNYKNFENAGQKETANKQEQFINSVPGSGKSFGANASDILSALENEYRMFVKINAILARQEYRKKRFYRNLKKALFAISAVFTFSFFFIFSKKRKVSKGEKMIKAKI